MASISRLAIALLSLAALSNCDNGGTPAAQDSSSAKTAYELGRVIGFGQGGGSEIYKRAGWNETEKDFTWTTGQSAKLLFRLAETEQPLTLRMRLGGFVKPPELPAQPVEVYVNNEKVADWIVSDPADFTALIPVDMANRTALAIELRTPKAASPKSIGANPDPRILGVNCFEVSITEAR